MSLYAELDTDNRVLRVIVCDSLDWIAANLGGDWMEVAESDGAGPGRYLVGGQFLPPWQPDTAYPVDSLVYHAGAAWRSDHDGNTDEPGVGGWVAA